MPNHSKPPVRKNWVHYTAAILTFLIVFSFFGAISYRLIIFRNGFLAEVLPNILIDLTNKNRLAYHLSKLHRSLLLEEAAQKKANDMAIKSYFAHQSPEGLTPWYWFKQVNYQFLYAGENLAVQFSDSADVVDAWMDSPGHRDNILNDHFTEIGIATAEGYYQGKKTVFVVQLFGRPSASLVVLPKPPAPILAEAETIPPQEVIREIASEEKEQQKFIAVENKAPLRLEPEVAGETTNYSRSIDRLLANPNLLLQIFYFTLGTIIIFLLLLGAFIELNKHHYVHMMYGAGLLACMFIMYFVYQGFFGQVEVLGTLLGV